VLTFAIQTVSPLSIRLLKYYIISPLRFSHHPVICLIFFRLAREHPKVANRSSHRYPMQADVNKLVSFLHSDLLLCPDLIFPLTGRCRSIRYDSQQRSALSSLIFLHDLWCWITNHDVHDHLGLHNLFQCRQDALTETLLQATQDGGCDHGGGVKIAPMGWCTTVSCCMLDV
jgi:hypothetical protein